MLEFTATRVNGGVVKLRTYLINKAIKDNLPIKVIYGVDYMIFTPEDLQKKVVRKGTTLYKSKTGGKDYYLWEYDWTPVEVEL